MHGQRIRVFLLHTAEQAVGLVLAAAGHGEQAAGLFGNDQPVVSKTTGEAPGGEAGKRSSVERNAAACILERLRFLDPALAERRLVAYPRAVELADPPVPGRRLAAGRSAGEQDEQ